MRKFSHINNIDQSSRDRFIKNDIEIERFLTKIKFVAVAFTIPGYQWTSTNLFLSNSCYVLQRRKKSSLVSCSPCKDDSNDVLHYILTISLSLQKLRKEKKVF